MNRRELIVGASLLSFAARATALGTQENRMRKLTVFNNVSLDGYFTDAQGDMSWAHSGSGDRLAPEA